jgi:UDP-glucuronate 4-epimerase
MKILVTGSAGFIGFHVAERLLQDGHHVIGVDSMVPYYEVKLKEKRHNLLMLHDTFKALIVDISDMAAIKRVVEEGQPEVIVHLAAQAGVRYALEHPEVYVTTNLVGTFNLLEICRRHPVQHLLMASTSSVYGGNTKMPFDETDPTDTPLTIYSATKRGTELVAHCYAHLWDQPITVFRFFSVYGPWGRPDMALFKFTASALKDEVIDVYNHGQLERDFTYIDDLVESIVRLIPCIPARGKPIADCDSLSPIAPFRTINIGSGNPIGLLDFIGAIERSLGRKIRRNYMDMQPGDVLKTWSNSDLLNTLTGFRPSYPVDRGVDNFVTWFRHHYSL